MWTIPAADTKAERRHAVPLSPVAMALLGGVPRIGPFVFTTRGKHPIASFAKMKGRLDAYLKASEPGIQPWRLHDLRRTAAPHMVRPGAREEVVGRILNHAVKGLTARVYALHSYGPEKRQALEAWAAQSLSRPYIGP